MPIAMLTRMLFYFERLETPSMKKHEKGTTYGVVTFDVVRWQIGFESWNFSYRSSSTYVCMYILEVSFHPSIPPNLSSTIASFCQPPPILPHLSTPLRYLMSDSDWSRVYILDSTIHMTICLQQIMTIIGWCNGNHESNCLSALRFPLSSLTGMTSIVLIVYCRALLLML